MRNLPAHVPALEPHYPDQANSLDHAVYEKRPSMFGKFHYYCQRLIVNPMLRSLVVGTLRRIIGKRADLGGGDSEFLDTLRDQGIVELGQVFNDAQCDEILDYLSDKPVYHHQVRLERSFCSTQPGDMGFGIHYSKHVLDCPHVMELVNSARIVKLAQEYLGCNPTLTCLGVQWSYPTTAPAVAQTFHRDAEGWKFLRFFVYLTDVEEGCGPHVYVRGSHKGKLPLRLKFYPETELAREYGPDSVVKMFGKRGAGIAADTCGIHKGELPTARARLVLNFTFAILPHPTLPYTPLRTRHPRHFINHTNRLFLR